IRSCGSGSPMTPVEEEMSQVAGTPSALATPPVKAETAAVPSLPVRALAFPELTMIAAPALVPSGFFSFASQSSTQAARVAEVVKAPAIVVPGASRTSVTSVRPGYRTPAATAANSTPAIRGSAGKPPFGASGETGLAFFLAAVAAACTASPTASPAAASAPSTTGATSVSRRIRKAFTLAFSFLASAFHSSFVLAISGTPCAVSVFDQVHVLQDRGVDAIHRLLDLRGVGQLGHLLLDRSALKLALKLCPHILDGRLGCGAHLRQPDDMPAELALHRGRSLARLHRDDRVLEGLHHHADSEPAEVSAGGGRPAVGRLLLGDGGKVGAAVEIGLDGLRLVFGRHEDMGGVVFLARLCRGILFVEERLDRVVGDGRARGLVECHAREISAPLVVEHERVALADAAFGHFGERFLLDDLVENAVEQRLVVELQVLRRQAFAHGDHVAKRDGLAVDGRHHGVGRRVFGPGGCGRYGE